MTKISVVIPLYNKKEEIQNTLNSVLNQSFTDFEVVVVDDGSTDGSGELVQANSDPRIRYLKTKNNGVSKARNIGIENSDAPLIAFLDADDTWKEHHLEDLIQLQNDFPSAGLYIKNYIFSFAQDYLKPTVFTGIDSKSFRGIVADFFKSSLPDRMAFTSSLAVPKYVFNKVGVFDETLSIAAAGEDTDMWIRIALAFPVAFDSKVSAIYQMDASNRISNYNTVHRNFPKLDKFLHEEKNNPSLKKFLDRIRAVYALKHKLAGEDITFKYYYNKIDLKNIVFKTRLLLKLPTPLLKILYHFKKKLEHRKIHLDSYN